MGKYFFFRVPVLMALDRCGLDELQCAFLNEFNIKLFIVVPFLTPSEALRVGTYAEKNISSTFQFSWPRVVAVL